MLEVYPETFAQLNSEAFAHILGTLDFGLHHQVIFGMCSFFNNMIKAVRNCNDRETSKLEEFFNSLAFSSGLLNKFLHCVLQFPNQFLFPPTGNYDCA